MQNVLGDLHPPYSKEQLVQLFTSGDLPLDALLQITARLDPEPILFPPNTRLMLQGEPGDGLYFIAQGTVEVTLTPFGPGSPFPPVTIAKLSAGGVVGEMALVNNEPRIATVTALDDVTAYRLSIDNWRYVEAFHPGLAAKIREVAVRRGSELARTQNV